MVQACNNKSRELPHYTEKKRNRAPPTGKKITGKGTSTRILIKSIGRPEINAPVPEH